MKLSDSPTKVTRSPLLGEHTDEVMAELGCTADQIALAHRRRDLNV
jgi:formyl-CoA transferase